MTPRQALGKAKKILGKRAYVESTLYSAINPRNGKCLLHCYQVGIIANGWLPYRTILGDGQTWEEALDKVSKKAKSGACDGNGTSVLGEK